METLSFVARQFYSIHFWAKSFMYNWHFNKETIKPQPARLTFKARAVQTHLYTAAKKPNDLI